MEDRFADHGDVVFQILKSIDIPDLHALHCDVLRTLRNRGFMYSHDLEYFRDVVERRGHVIGAYAANRLLGYGAFLKPGEQVAGHGHKMRHLGINPGSIAESAGAAVHPDCRKQGLFTQLIRERFRLGGQLGYAFMSCVVSPENLVSLKVLLQTQCIMVANHRDIDGDNYLLLKPLTEPFSCPEYNGSIVELNDCKGHFQHLSDGKKIGIADTRKGKLAVKYVAIQSHHLPWLTKAGENIHSPVQNVGLKLTSTKLSG
jgi:ribosomal protein S18 acetylase RimI-like enzyme